MPSASAITSRLQQAVAASDRPTTMQCLRAYVYDRTLTWDDRAAAVDAILHILEVFPRDAAAVGGSFCAMAHVTTEDASFSVAAILHAIKHHEKNAMVVAAAARLLSNHVHTSRVLETLPPLAEAAAEWIQLHPTDHNIAYWAAHILIKAAGQEPDDVKTEHGSIGVEGVDVAVVKGAVATQRIEVYVNGTAWNAHVLANLYPRLRVRA